MEPISSKELRDRLRKERTVAVSGMTFLIRRVPLLLLADESDGLWETARQGTDALIDKVKTLATNPSLGRLRRVLLAGVVQPRLSGQEDTEAVSVDLLLSDYALAVGLFIEIVRFSLET